MVSSDGEIFLQGDSTLLARVQYSTEQQITAGSEVDIIIKEGCSEPHRNTTTS
jgi:hypothetical protein